VTDLRERDHESRPESADAGDEPDPTRDVVSCAANVHAILLVFIVFEYSDSYFRVAEWAERRRRCLDVLPVHSEIANFLSILEFAMVRVSRATLETLSPSKAFRRRCGYRSWPSS
jgi:hypothetical protein